MDAERHIGDCPSDGRDWECCCARCGSSLTFEECETCGGEGLDGHDCGEDCCFCLDPEDNVTCDACRGEGSFPACMSSPEWCEANPIPGREGVKPHTPEWYTFDPPDAAIRAAGGVR